MAAGDIIRSSLFTDWYNRLNSVLTKYGPDSGNKTILMYSGNKNVGSGAGLQEMWRGTVPESMTIKSVTTNIYVCNSGGGATYAPRIYIQVGSSTTNVVSAGASVNSNHTWSGSISAQKGQTISLWSAGDTGSSRQVTKFIYGALTYTPWASPIGTLNTGEVAVGNHIDTSDFNSLISKYNALKADPILGSVPSLYPSISTVSQGSLIRWSDITNAATTHSNIGTITCRQTITNQTSCSQNYSQYYGATGCAQWQGCGDYHEAWGCAQWQGCGDYHDAWGCGQWAGCNQWETTGCRQWRWYSPAICVGNCSYGGCWQWQPWCTSFVGVGWDCANCSNSWCVNNWHAAWGCNNWWCVNNHHDAWGCNNWWCVNNYVAEHTNNVSGTVSNCSFTTTVKIR